VATPDEQRLLPEPVTGENDVIAARVVDRYREHPVATGEDADTPFHPTHEQDLSVALGVKDMASRDELFSKLDEVVDATVEEQSSARLTVQHGLIGALIE